jgi:hypothetical protein
LAATLAGALGIGGLAAEPPAFKDTPGKHLDVLVEGKVAARYMYEHDTSTKALAHDTYKPYLHVFDAEGKAPITKGAGGDYTHHRGIFIGWNKIGFGGKTYDRWHMKGGEIVHQEFPRQEIKDGAALFTSRTLWMAEADRPLLEEKRTMTIAPGRDGVRLVIDFHSELHAKFGAVSLKGDPEHAGIHYRPAQGVDLKATKYWFPEEKVDVPKARDLPWAAETYVLGGRKHTVVQLNHPSNPKGTRHSAYRDYGRFGMFFEKDIPEGGTLEVRYRFLILDGEFPGREVIAKFQDEFAK